MIKGFRGTSLVDFPGKIASVIFTYTCNFRCPYCYNVELIKPEYYQNLETIPEETILKELKRRKDFIKGVVITGGEPTLWGKKLVSLLEKIKIESDLAIKLDTNGSQPELVKFLIENKLIDYLALDFKTSPKRYGEVGGNFEKVKKTLFLLEKFLENSEVRITLYPPLVGFKELEEMLPFLKGVKNLALQKFLPEKTLKEEEVTPYKLEVYQKIHAYLEEKLPEVKIWVRYE